MRKLIFISLIFITGFNLVQAQQDRINYNGQKLFLSGANLAWLNFARDIGPGEHNFNSFADIFLSMHDQGGNALRWWLHTNGTVTPEFNSSGFVTGPGSSTISDIRKVLDLAWEREIGVILTLWSFDMLRSTNNINVLNRNTLLLTDTTYTKAYINNSLIPMIDSLKGHPAIIAWEIFNEPEGMSSEFGWSGINRVSMSAIQRFINLCAGAIHRTDPNAKVTSGAAGFSTLTDVVVIAKIGTELAQLSSADKKEMEEVFFQKYRLPLKADEIIQHFKNVESMANFNYYSDSRLIASGNDKDGTLDFFSVHYYSWAGTLSPFVRSATFWNLDKPTVVAEFYMTANNNVPKEYLFSTLYSNGYAGALPWSWTDNAVTKVEDMLAGMKFMWDNYRSAVDVNGIGGDWPTVSITSPLNDAIFPDNAQVKIDATAADKDGTVTSVTFYANDTLKIAEIKTEPYTYTWTNIKPGIYSLTAIATDNEGNKRTSNRVSIKVGTLPLVRLEAEAAMKQGNFTVVSDLSASNRAYVNFATNDSTTKITWQLKNVPVAGSYEIAFGYRLAYDTPKSQYINVNGVRVTELVFNGNTNVWLEKKLTVNLVQGVNAIQMQMSWGWMHVDYLAVPASLVTSVETIAELPQSFSLQQNYPNPFNPETVISYLLPVNSLVVLKIYDLLGREVATLVNETQTAGIHRSTFNSLHYSLSSGVYFYTLKAGDFVESKKMILLK